MKSKIVAVLLSTIAVVAAQGQTIEGYKPSPGGILYKILAAGHGKTMAHGNFFELSYKVSYKDSIMVNSELYANSIVALDSTSLPIAIYNIFKQCGLGDTVLTQTLTDSAYSGADMPPGIQAGEYVQSDYKVVNIFTTKAEADSAFQQMNKIMQAKAEAAAKKQAAADEMTIKSYLALKKIIAVRAPMGTYIEMTVPGKGKKINDSVSVNIKYTGRTLAGVVFDSNMEPGREPITVAMWQPEVIPGWVEGLRYFAPGAKGRLYIPSGLGYGPEGAGEAIGPNEILVFDMEVVKVAPKPMPAKPKVVKKAPTKKAVAKKPVKKVAKKK